MGMFDTVVFQKPIICKCGHKLESSKIKEFDCALDVYRVGDMIPSAPLFALFEEFDYCDSCSAHIEFFVACSYGIYLGVFQSYREAKDNIDNFGMEELLKFYAKRVPPQRGLFNDSSKRFMERLVEFYESSPKKEEGRFSALFALHGFEEETPLEAIKNYLKKDELEKEIKRLYSEKLEFDISYKMINEDCVEIYNQKIESALGLDYLFRIVKIEDRRDSTLSEDNTLVSYGDLNESVIWDRVQYWLDTHRISLQVVIAGEDKEQQFNNTK